MGIPEMIAATQLGDSVSHNAYKRTSLLLAIVVVRSILCMSFVKTAQLGAAKSVLDPALLQ